MLNGPVWENANGVDSASNRSSVKPIAINIACNILLVPKNGKLAIKKKWLLTTSDTTKQIETFKENSILYITRQTKIGSMRILRSGNFVSALRTPLLTQLGEKENTQSGNGTLQKIRSGIGSSKRYNAQTNERCEWDAKASSHMRKFGRFTMSRRGYASTAVPPMIRQSEHSTLVTVYPFSTKREET